MAKLELNNWKSCQMPLTVAFKAKANAAPPFDLRRPAKSVENFHTHTHRHNAAYHVNIWSKEKFRGGEEKLWQLLPISVWPCAMIPDHAKSSRSNCRGRDGKGGERGRRYSRNQLRYLVTMREQVLLATFALNRPTQKSTNKWTSLSQCCRLLFLDKICCVPFSTFPNVMRTQEKTFLPLTLPKGSTNK